MENYQVHNFLYKQLKIAEDCAEEVIKRFICPDNRIKMALFEIQMSEFSVFWENFSGEKK